MRGSAPVVVLIAAAAALNLLPLTLHPTSFPFPPDGAYSDALISHLTSARFLHRSMLAWGQIPLWNPTILSGIPFAADPLSGLWYPPFWTLALLPQAIVINLLLWSHIAFGGYGFYRLLRAEGLGRLGALSGALAFAGMPKLGGHVGLGHLSLVAAVCWTPWTLLAAAWSVSGLENERWLGRFVVWGISLGVVFLVDPRWFPPVFAVAVAFGGWRWAMVQMKGNRGVPRLAGAAGAVLAGIVAAAAGLAVPMGQFVLLTTRSAAAASQADVFALPAQRLLGLVIATRGSWAEWTASMGSVVLVAAAVGAAAYVRRNAFWIALVFVAILLALGLATPIGRLVSLIPGASLLRVPARWMFFAGMGLAALAGYGVDAFRDTPDAGRAHRVRRAAVIAGGAIALLAVGLTAVARVPASVVVSGLFGLLAVAAFILAGRTRSPSWLPALMPALLAVELIWLDVAMIQPHPPDVALTSGRAAVESLADLPAGTRVFSPSYSVPQEAAAEAGLSMADGVHPLQLSDYVRFMAAATGFDAGPYSVTLPPFPSGEPGVDWGPTIDSQALGLLAVSRVVSAYPLDSPGLELIDRSHGLFVYENLEARPRAWIEPTGGGPASDWRAAESVEWTPNRVRIRAEGPGTLVLSDPVYPGWRARLDGRAVAIRPRHEILRSVDLPAGEHEVVFTFVPLSLAWGLALSLLGWAVSVALWRRG